MAKIINGSTIQLALADYLATNAYLNDTAQDVLCMVAKWIDEAPEIKMPTWIPVTERLPEQGQEVIVYDGGVLKPKVFCYLFWDKHYDNWARVTHWMPLPEPPKEVE